MSVVGIVKITKCRFEDGTPGFAVEETLGTYNGNPQPPTTTFYTRTVFPTDLFAETETDKRPGVPNGLHT